MPQPVSEDDAETINMGPPSEIRAAISARRAQQNNSSGQQTVRGVAPQVSPSVIVDRGLRAQTPRAGRADEPDLDDDPYELGDTADEHPGERDRTLRRAREAIDAEHERERERELEDSGEDDIVNTFEQRGSKLREAMAKRPSAAPTDMPKVVHAMFAETRGDGWNAERNRATPPVEADAPERGDPTVQDPRPASRRRLPEPTRPPTPRVVVGGRSDVMAVPTVAPTPPPVDRAAPVVVPAVTERSAPVAITAPGVGSSVYPRLPSTVDSAPQHYAQQFAPPPQTRPTSSLRRGPRLAIAILVLVVLTAASFFIALSTHGR
jgi:hypothetical protein